MRDMLITEQQRIHTHTKRSHGRHFFNAALKPNAPPYASPLPERRSEKKRKQLAVRPTPIVKPASWPASNNQGESVQGQLQLSSFSSQTE